MLSKHSRNCLQICESASLPFLCCKHEEGLGGCLSGFVLVCVLHPQLKKLGVAGTSHEVSFYFLRLSPNAFLRSL